MPEFPDIEIYTDAIRRRVMDERLLNLALNNPFLLRTVEPSIAEFKSARVAGVDRMGKRIVIVFNKSESQNAGRLWLVLHLMIAGRLHWKPAVQKPPGKSALLILEFESGYLYLTEAGSKRRASLHLFNSEATLREIDPGGLEMMSANLQTFVERFTAANHTLKRALTDPRILSGIGNAYSDEILHHAKLSPLQMTQKLGADELQRLYVAIRESLNDWTDNLRKFYGDKFPEKVTAFRDDMAVHGRYGKPCPECGAPVQRIVYSSNECNYCPGCQTGGRIFADRALSQLLKKDWPRTLDELEKLQRR